MITKATEQTLNDIMDLDHVIEVLEDGFVDTDPRYGDGHLYAPAVYAEQGSEPYADAREDWTFLSGYTQQYSYSGPVMHNSEFIGGPIARDILAKPGFYVASPVMWITSEGEDETEDDNIEGWVVAYLPPVAE